MEDVFLFIIILLLLLGLLYVIRKLFAEIKFQKNENIKLDGELRSLSVNINTLLKMLADLHEFNISTKTVLNNEELYNKIVENASKLLKTEIVSLMLFEKSTNELKIVAAKGLSESIIKNARLKIGEGIAGKVVQEGIPIFVENIETDIRFQRASNVKYSSKSFISVPLKVKDKVIGVLNVNNKESKKMFDDSEMRLLTILVDLAATTIENVELYKNMQRIYLGTIQTLARAIDAKSPFTKEHTERVTKYAKKIAERMHISTALIKNIENAAMMHDIGKIGVSEKILNKPGPLTEEEREVMNAHPLIGERIIMPIEFLATIAPLVLYHHEQYDGSGYLEGLSGEEIPIGARVLAVADAYDAMTSDRAYKKAKTKEEAIIELRRCSGTQFDPKIAEIFINYLKNEDQDQEEETEETEHKISFTDL